MRLYTTSWNMNVKKTNNNHKYLNKWKKTIQSNIVENDS